MNTWKNKDPLSVKVRSVERIVGPKATDETCHIVMETQGKAPMWEGQSYGVIPPVCPRPALPQKLFLGAPR
jgi:ferredoxin--NADP+ reductase